MKSFVCVVLMAMAAQTAYSFVINPCGTPVLSNQVLTNQIISSPILTNAGPIITNPCGGPILTNPCAGPIIASPQTIIRAPQVISATVAPSNSVANSLADTLSLLTVSSLLAETLPMPAVVPIAGYPVTSLPVVGGCGCGGLNTIYI